MKNHGLARWVESKLLSLVLWLFTKTECRCPDCTRHREQFERRRP